MKATPAGWLHQAKAAFPADQADMAQQFLAEAKSGRHIEPPLMHVSFLVLNAAGTSQSAHLPADLPCWCKCGVRSVKLANVERRCASHRASRKPQVLPSRANPHNVPVGTYTAH